MTPTNPITEAREARNRAFVSVTGQNFVPTQYGISAEDLDIIVTALDYAQTQAAEIERLEDRVHEAEMQPWPQWADDISKKLMEFGYDAGPEGEWNIGECFEDWMDGTLDEYERQNTSLKAQVESLKAERDEERKAANNAVKSAHAHAVNLNKIITAILPRGPMCRDCADEDGTCPHKDGLPCDPYDEVIERFSRLKAKLAKAEEVMRDYLDAEEIGDEYRRQEELAVGRCAVKKWLKAAAQFTKGEEG